MLAGACSVMVPSASAMISSAVSMAPTTFWPASTSLPSPTSTCMVGLMGYSARRVQCAVTVRIDPSWAA